MYSHVIGNSTIFQHKKTKLIKEENNQITDLPSIFSEN